MDSFELNKIAGAVLAALLIIVGSKTFIEIATTPHSGGEHEVVGYVLPKPDGEAGSDGHGAAGGAGEAAEAFDAAKVAELVGAADAAKGEKLFKKCTACHTSDKDGANKVGPALWGVAGRAKASHEGFGYSDAMKAKGGDWDNESLAHFLHKPKEFIEGTKMVFAGFSDNNDVANIVAYLNTLK